MAQKTIKKRTKTTTATKRVAKKTTKSAAVRNVTTPVVTEKPCSCGHECHCCCCRGRRVINLFIKIIILCIVFLLGCMASPWMVRDHGKAMMHGIKFDDNGCVMLDTVKCPKMLEVLATSDDDANGCISRMELKHAMIELRKGRPMPADEMPTEPMAE